MLPGFSDVAQEFQEDVKTSESEYVTAKVPGFFLQSYAWSNLKHNV